LVSHSSTINTPRTAIKAPTMRVADSLKLGIENLLTAEVVAGGSADSVTRGCKGNRGNDCSGCDLETLDSVALCCGST